MQRDNIYALRQREVELTAKSGALLDAAKAAGRDLNADEAPQFNNLKLAIAKNKVAITECENQMELQRNMPGIDVTDGMVGVFPQVTTPKGPRPGSTKYAELFGLQGLSRAGFESSGEFFNAVHRSREIADPRLLRSAGIQAAGGQREAQPSQGGF